MKKILALLFLISSFAQAQYSVKATMSPTIKSDWVVLYKIEGAKQKFVQNSSIKIDTVTTNEGKQALGNFSFTLPKDAEVGAYRLTYRLEGAGFIDFLFNKEDVSFSFNPNYPDYTANFSKSEENKIYTSFLNLNTNAQQELDSLQVAYLKDTNLRLKGKYRAALKKVNNIQTEYLKISKGMYVNSFIKANFKNNPTELITTPKDYMSNMTSTFFDNVDFNNKTLLNSSFITDKIADYVFYINYSEDKEMQQKLHKSAINTVLSKINEPGFKRDVIEFLVTQFETNMDVDLIDFLLEKYNALPYDYKNNKFVNEKIALLAAEVGRTAPDFYWKEGKKTFRLSELKGAENYILVFWSTTCSHCLREIPELHKFTIDNKDVKVIAFSLEDDKYGWESYKENLYGWHNVLGLEKWKNKTARTYNIHSTPSYFILNADKKIIAKPEELKDVKLFLDKK